MKKIQYKQHHAFTMIELIMVVVILGIVSSIGSEIIAKVYENYILQRATHRASLKTELAAQQIANMLSYRIPGTTLARNPNNLADNVFVTENTEGNDTNHTALEWIGEDNDGFSAATPPAWNGFCDVNASSQTTITTPGSMLTQESSMISSFFTGAGNPAIFFRAGNYSHDSSAGLVVPYNALACMGMTDNNRSCISTVTVSDNEHFAFSVGSTNNKKVIAEHYKLAWTAYAIVPFKADGSGPCRQDGTGTYDSLCNLRLYYNYQPWNGTRLTTVNYNTIPHATILNNISVFKFAESGGTFRFKVCSQENIGGDYNVTICKEKAVVR